MHTEGRVIVVQSVFPFQPSSST